MVVGFSPLAADLDKDEKVDYGVAPMPTKDGGEPQTFGVDRLPDGVQEAGQPGRRSRRSTTCTTSRTRSTPSSRPRASCRSRSPASQQFASRPKLKTYLDTLPNAQLTPTDDPTWDRVKLAVQQNIGGGAPNGDPKAVLDELQKTAENGG